MFINRLEWEFFHKRILKLGMDCVRYGLFEEQIVKLHRKINELGTKLSARIEETDVDAVICKVCGCFINRENAIKGESEIKKSRKLISYKDCIPVTQDTEVIYSPYYCKVHAPKTPKTGGKK